jgi:O-antigen/teichoic acid export membrane protein
MSTSPPSDSTLGTIRVAANTAVQAAGTVAGALLGLATFLVLTRRLGPSTYGEFAAATAYLSVPIVIADVGLTAGVLREISAHPSRTERVMRSFLPLSAIVSMTIVLLLLGVALVLPFNSETKTAIAIGSLGAFFTLMSLSLSPVMQARLQMHWVVAANIVGRAFTLGLVAAAVAADMGLKAVMAAWVAGLALTCLIQTGVVLRQISLKPMIDVRFWWQLLGTSVFLGVANALGQINFRIGTIILAWFRSSAVVGYYGAAYKFVELVHSTSGAVGISVFPSFARLAAAGDRRLGTLVQRSLDVMAALAGAAVVLITLFPDEIIRWTAGAEFLPGATALRILALFVPFGLFTHVLWRLLMALHEDRRLAWISGGALTAAVALDLALIPSFGMNAAAIVTVAVEVALSSTCAAVVVRRHALELNMRFLPSVLLAGAAAVAVALLVPGPAVIAFSATLLAYAAVIVAAPGTGRELVVEFARALRPAQASERPS